MTGKLEPSPVLKDLEAWHYPVHAAVVIRHAEREPLTGLVPKTLPLTPRGHELAVALGGLLGNYRHVRIFHSPALRCEQTAIDISKGAVESGTALTSVRCEKLLGFSYILDRDRVWGHVERLPDGFFRNWLLGRLDPTLVKPVDVTAQEHVALVLRTMSEASDGPRLDVFVTHDLNILVLWEGLLKIRHEELENPEFLDGVTFRLDQGGLLARYRNRIRRVDVAVRKVAKPGSVSRP